MDFLSFYWRDVLDIALVTLLLYRILLLIRGTRAFSALIGLVVLVAVYALSHFIGLYSLSWLLENLFGSLFLVIVILFHDDIRQALAAMGTQYLSWKETPRAVKYGRRSRLGVPILRQAAHRGSHRSGRQGAAWRHDEGRGSTGRPDIPGAPADHLLSQYRAARWGGDHPQRAHCRGGGVSCRWRRWTARISVRGTAPRLALRKSAMRRSLSFQRNAAK